MINDSKKGMSIQAIEIVQKRKRRKKCSSMRNEILTIINQLLLNDGTADTQLSSTAQKLLKSKKQNEYIKDINEFIKKTESEIEAICNDNHHVRTLMQFMIYLCGTIQYIYNH